MHTVGPTTVETATDSPDELALLAAVMADPLAETPRLVYADWLDDRGDPRGQFLRDFVGRARDPSAQLPSGDDLPMAWRQLVGVWPRHRIRAAFDRGPPGGVPVAHVERELMRRARPALHLLAVPAADADLPPGGTKLGGRPDLPVGVGWPVGPRPDPGLSRVGVFCAQIRLSELRGTMVGRELPAEGVLSFFRGHGTWGPVLRSPERGSFYRPDPPPDPAWDAPYGGYFPRVFYPLPAAAARLIEGIDLPLGNDLRALPKAFWDEVDPRWLEGRLELRPAAFGYGVPHHQLLGYGREANAYPAPDRLPGGRRLATFGSHHDSPWYWGDSGQPFWHITDADLADGYPENAGCYAG